MEFCNQSWNFFNVASEFYKTCERCIFQLFHQIVANAKFEQRDGHGIFRNCNKKSRAKCVGTLELMFVLTLEIEI